LSNKNFLKVS